MENLKTITEHRILSLAWSELMNLKARQESILKEFPDNPISKYYIAKDTEQIAEISKRILEIERELAHAEPERLNSGNLSQKQDNRRT